MQHGFQAGRSCLTQLLHHLDDITEALTNDADFDTIYLDYAKAFDKVDHKLLLHKLHLYGIHPKMIKWIESFLCGRKQTVVVNGTSSSPADIISGVPQGTVLGPILFLIFINDIEHCISHSIVRCFADDTKICKHINSTEDVAALQSDLENVIKWSQLNNMSLHKDKFEYISHTFNQRNLMYELPFWIENFTYNVSEDLTLFPVDQLRDLGVIFTSEVSWSVHIRSITEKARKKAAWVFSVFSTRTPLVMLTLFNSMVRSQLEYCCPLWNPIKISDIQELESVQKVFLSRISGTDGLNYWEMLQHFSLMSLQRRRERYMVIHMWKMLNGRATNDINVQFIRRPRLGNQARVPSISRSSSKKNQSLRDASFSVVGPRLWNSIPHSFTTMSELGAFKSRITELFMKIPDKPPLRGMTTKNSNSILDWRIDKETSDLWGCHRR